jgi:hypothetical protein
MRKDASSRCWRALGPMRPAFRLVIGFSVILALATVQVRVGEGQGAGRKGGALGMLCCSRRLAVAVA